MWKYAVGGVNSILRSYFLQQYWRILIVYVTCYSFIYVLMYYIQHYEEKD